MVFNPEPLTFSDGRPVTAADWPRRREELINLVCTGEYGYLPAAPANLVGEVTESVVGEKYPVVDTVSISFTTPKGAFTFPMRLYHFADGNQHPVFILLHYGDSLNDDHFPYAEMLDAGVSVAVLNCAAIAPDSADPSAGIGGHYPEKDPDTHWGKLAMWAWGVSRCVDYLRTRQDVAPAALAVVGHSRLGKAVMLCAAVDERIAFAFINDSGCGGAALEQTKAAGAETIAFMNDRFPYWFCKKRVRYAEDLAAMPFDQHFVLAAIAPRCAVVGAAKEDAWSDPYAMQLCCVAASPAWEMLGQTGFVGNREPMQAGEACFAGRVGYYLREGGHALNRTDWLNYLAFFKQHRHQA